MAIPDYETLMLPLLKYLKDEKEHSTQELYEHLSQVFNLTPEERLQKLPSGQDNLFENRVRWAKLYLKKAGLLEDPRRGYVKITPDGLKLLAQNPEKINVKLLEQFPKFKEFKSTKTTEDKQEIVKLHQDIEKRTPDDLIEEGYSIIRKNLGQELLERLKTSSPSFFEKVVLKLLSAMGYGEGKVTGRSGDGGIDGFIHQDRLGLDKIFFQAKRFGDNNPVTPSMMRDFIGALDQKGASKGVFITTSRFTQNPESIRSSKSIVWIDGNKLVELLIDCNVGVSLEKTYQIKKIDEDFFLE